MDAQAAPLPGSRMPTPREAAQLQGALAPCVELTDRFGSLRWIAGVDLSFNRFARTVYAAAAVVDLTDLTLVDSATAAVDVDFPYVPGLLAFREVPAVVVALRKLATRPDLIVTDGHGLAHPRRFGLACHLGLALDVPTIGAAKSLLVGEIAGSLGARAAASAPIVHAGQTVGHALRTLERAGPIYVSPGHRVSLESTLAIALRLRVARRRILAPIAHAHALANAARREALAGSIRPGSDLACGRPVSTGPRTTQFTWGFAPHPSGPEAGGWRSGRPAEAPASGLRPPTWGGAPWQTGTTGAGCGGGAST